MIAVMRFSGKPLFRYTN